MKLSPKSKTKKYLQETECINYGKNIILEKSKEIKKESDGKRDYIRRCFEFVRDEIKHHVQNQDKKPTLKASQALKEGFGLCYSKSHLLAALLRARGIPAGICYQKVKNGDNNILHSVCAAYHKSSGWFRLDCGSADKHVEFDLNGCVAYDEYQAESMHIVYKDATDNVIKAHEKAETAKELLKNLPSEE